MIPRLFATLLFSSALSSRLQHMDLSLRKSPASRLRPERYDSGETCVPCYVSYYFDRLPWLSTDRFRFAALPILFLTSLKMLKLMFQPDHSSAALFALAACAFWWWGVFGTVHFHSFMELALYFVH